MLYNLMNLHKSKITKMNIKQNFKSQNKNTDYIKFIH